MKLGNISEFSVSILILLKYSLLVFLFLFLFFNFLLLLRIHSCSNFFLAHSTFFLYLLQILFSYYKQILIICRCNISFFIISLNIVDIYIYIYDFELNFLYEFQHNSFNLINIILSFQGISNKCNTIISF